MPEHRRELPEEPPVSGTRLAGVEGLRGVAAVTVMLSHTAIILAGVASPWALGKLVGVGLQGVTLFFVLSGFLLYRPFASAAIRSMPRPNTRDFYWNRALRIYPAYLVILAISGLIAGVAVTQALKPGMALDADRVGYLTDPVLLGLNALLLQGFVPSGMHTGLSVSWSLVPELSFYIVLPLLGLVAARLARGRKHVVAAALAPAIAFLVIGTVARNISIGLINDPGIEDLAVRQSGESWVAVFTNSIVVNADLFGLGMFLAALVAAARSGRLSARTIRVVRTIGVILVPISGFLAVLAGAAEVSAPYFGLASFGVLAYLMLPGEKRLQKFLLRLLETRPMHGLGLISYSVYLWHFPLLLFIAEHFDWFIYKSMGGLLIVCVAVSVLTIALSTATYVWVEAPALRRKRRPVPAPKATAGEQAVAD